MSKPVNLNKVVASNNLDYKNSLLITPVKALES